MSLVSGLVDYLLPWQEILPQVPFLTPHAKLACSEMQQLLAIKKGIQRSLQYAFFIYKWYCSYPIHLVGDMDKPLLIHICLSMLTVKQQRKRNSL